MENDNINQVRSDLRLLRKIQHSIDIQLEVEEGHKKRLVLLMEKKQTQSVQEDINKLQDIISKLNTEEYISRALAIEAKYIDAINKLEPLDRTIIMDGYINGKAYWKLGNKIGYTEQGIQKRVNKILVNIAKHIEEDLKTITRN